MSRAAAGSARPFGNVVISLSRFDYEDREAVLAQHMKYVLLSLSSSLISCIGVVGNGGRGDV